jgi:hypothetical protein
MPNMHAEPTLMHFRTMFCALQLMACCVHRSFSRAKPALAASASKLLHLVCIANNAMMVRLSSPRADMLHLVLSLLSLPCFLPLYFSDADVH